MESTPDRPLGRKLLAEFGTETTPRSVFPLPPVVSALTSSSKSVPRISFPGPGPIRPGTDHALADFNDKLISVVPVDTPRGMSRQGMPPPSPKNSPGKRPYGCFVNNDTQSSRRAPAFPPEDVLHISTEFGNMEVSEDPDGDLSLSHRRWLATKGNIPSPIPRQPPAIPRSHNLTVDSISTGAHTTAINASGLMTPVSSLPMVVLCAPTPPSMSPEHDDGPLESSVFDSSAYGMELFPPAGSAHQWAATPKKRLKQCPETPMKTPISARMRSGSPAYRSTSPVQDMNNLDTQMFEADLRGHSLSFNPQIALPECTCEQRDGHPCSSPHCAQIPQSFHMSGRSFSSSRHPMSPRVQPLALDFDHMDSPPQMLPADDPLPPPSGRGPPPSPSPMRHVRTPNRSLSSHHRRTVSEPFLFPGNMVPPPPSIPRDVAPHYTMLGSSFYNTPSRSQIPCNVNPYSPDASSLQSSKISAMSTSSEYSVDELDSFTVDTCTNRYDDEYEQLRSVGSGSFGEVFEVRRRIDGWRYAIKRSNKPMKSQADRRNHLREVYALAAIGDCPHVVRYYDAWFENDLLYIVTEFCDQGSLSDFAERGIQFSEVELIRVLKEVGMGLRRFHSLNLVHLDIKPDNIYVSSNVCKIGDLGLAKKADSSEVVEGDSRYLCREVLNEDTSNLPKADIFALGMSIYELASGQGLPSSGDEWNALRDGVIELPPRFSTDFVHLIRSMLAKNANDRPSAQELLQHPLLADMQTQVASLNTELSLSNKAQENMRREVQKVNEENRKLKAEMQRLRNQMQEWAIHMGVPVGADGSLPQAPSQVMAS